MYYWMNFCSCRTMGIIEHLPFYFMGGILLLIVGGIATGFMVYFMSQVIYAFGINGYIPSFFAAWTPALIAALISVSILLHLEDG